MALTLTPFFVEKKTVLPLVVQNSGATLRITALTTDYLGTLNANGSNGKVAWSIFYNKPWLTLETDPQNPNQAKIKFTGPSAEAGIVQCFVQADDGQTKVKYPIAIEVREPLSLTVSGGRNGRYDNLSAYDSSIAPLILTPVGIHNQPISDGSVKFVMPSDLPQGVLFTVTESGATLSMAPPDTKSISGGMTPSRPTSYRIKAYRPGSMYDSVDRALTFEVTVGTLTSRLGTLSSAFSCVFDDAGNYYHLSLSSDYLEGTGPAFEYMWEAITADGAAGSFTNGGDSQDSFAQWTPSASGSVTFRVKLIDASSKETLLERFYGPLNVTSDPSWDAGNAVKLLVDSPLQASYLGQTASFLVSVPTGDFAVGETLTVTTSIAGVAGETSITPPAPFALTLGDNSRLVTLTLPTTGKFRDKWEVVFTATDGATRVGKAKAVILSKGQPIFSINNNALISVVQNTGFSITPVKLVASRMDNLEPLDSVTYSLVGAPAGISIKNGEIVGETASLGTHSFRVMGVKNGYAPSFTPVSLEVRAFESPLSVMNFSSDVAQAAEKGQVNLSWGFSGSAKSIILQTNNDKNVANLTTSTSYSLELLGTSVFSLVGQDYKGPVYSVPLIVTSSSTAGLTKLPSSPTIATIDETNTLRVNWSPLPVNDSYGLYDYWKIQTKTSPTALAADLIDPFSTNTPKTGPTGLVESGASLDSRIFVQALDDDNYWMSMQAISKNRNIETGGIEDSNAWPQFYAFPGKLIAGSLSMDKTTVKLKESLTIQVGLAYTAADYWRITFSDGTSTGWLPLSVKSQSKLFTVPGNQTALVEFERDYSSLTPRVKLRRSVQLEIYVQNEVYNAPSSEIIGVGNIGLGGEAGFEIADDTGAVEQREPYAVIVKALVKDDITQELKMLVATSRNHNASSILNTMAADVFPLVGRPHLKDLVAPASSLFGEPTLVSPVSITTTALPDVFVGRPMPEVKLLASGGTAPYEWYSDSLPFGVKLSTDGTLTGTPLSMGNYNINISVKDSTIPSFIAETSLAMLIKSDLRLPTTSPKDAVVGQFYQNQMVATGGLPPYSWSVRSGKLPVGVTLSPSGVLAGYPCSYNSDEDFDKAFLFVAEVVDAVGAVSSSDYYLNLRPMPLQMGEIDQPTIQKGADFKLSIPVFGGRSPYSVSSFTNDGSLGSSLSVVSPDTIDIISGQGTAPLTIITGDQIFSPSAYPYQAVFSLSAAGGTAPYRWSLNTSDPSLNTATNPAVSASQAVATLSADGASKIHVSVTDANGDTRSKVLTLNSTLNGGSGGTGPYSLEYVVINKNGSTDVMNWTFTKINSLPDAKIGTSYRPDPSNFYGLAVWNPTANRMYDLRSEATRVQLKHLYSRVGGLGAGASSPLVLRAVSLQRATLPDSTGIGSTTWWGSGSTAITQALFKSNGAVAMDGTPYPSAWQDIDNDQLYISQATIGLPASGVWSWAIGSATTLPSGYRPQFLTSTGITGSSVTTNEGGYVRLKPATIPEMEFKTLAEAQSAPYVLEIVATDAQGRIYSALFNYYLVSGGTVQAREIGNWLAGTVVIWPDGTTIGYTSPFSQAGLGDVVLSGPQSTITLANNTSGTVNQSGVTTPYFPMGVTYFQGDYNRLTTLQMTVGDQTAVAPVKGSLSTPQGTNPYTFLILNDTGTAEANAKISTLGGYSIGSVTTDVNISKEMAISCTTDGGGVTPVITISSVNGDALQNPWASRFDANGVFLGNPERYAEWYFILKANGGSGPYTYRLASGTTLPGVSIHNAQNTADFGVGTDSSPDLRPYSGDFLLVSYTPEWTSESVVKAGAEYVVKISATDSNGFVSTVATIPFRVLPITTSSVPTTLQVLSNTLSGGRVFISGPDVTSAQQVLTLNAPAVWTLSGELPAGLFLCPQGQPSVKMRGPEITGGATTNKLTAQAVQLIGVPSGSPSTVTVQLQASAIGFTPLSVPLTLNAVNRVATITVLNGGNATPGTTYSYITGSPFVKLHCEGFDVSNSPDLTTNLGTLRLSYPTNIVTHYPGAMTFDLMFDYSATTAGSGSFSLINAGELVGKASFTVLPASLAVSGQTTSQSVSEYAKDPFTMATPPVSIAGGVAPFTVEALTVSNPSVFYIQGGKFYLDVTKVAGGNSYTTNVTYKVTDSRGTSATTSTPASVTVNVLAENYMTANFVSRSRNILLGALVDIPALDFISVQLGHAPFTFFVDNIEFNDPSMANWVSISPTGRYIIVNSTTSDVTWQDMGDRTLITQTASDWISRPSNPIELDRPALDDGSTFVVGPATLPPPGAYTATLALRVVDSKGLSVSGTATLTLYVQ